MLPVNSKRESRVTYMHLHSDVITAHVTCASISSLHRSVHNCAKVKQIDRPILSTLLGNSVFHYVLSAVQTQGNTGQQTKQQKFIT